LQLAAALAASQLVAMRIFVSWHWCHRYKYRSMPRRLQRTDL